MNTCKCILCSVAHVINVDFHWKNQNENKQTTVSRGNLQHDGHMFVLSAYRVKRVRNRTNMVIGLCWGNNISFLAQ